MKRLELCFHLTWITCGSLGSTSSMPLLRGSNLLPDVSVLFWKVLRVRCSLTHPVVKTDLVAAQHASNLRVGFAV